ncbi:universal stress protein [Halapricum hydrolyticum]|uniref:Universal stress protein n=1 Tax=Halapricum hydrolyticum TaxID=2979991 RepID=A0AAE3IC43_9EURY|nr:universal stress protein [Halapricum hydrolyticum]MCU4717909.1 universal stress protein [Halapricum hydrolyticum]MCU4727074.1 universal stress protein [Halapricum hydrolyticum]
MTRVVVPIRYPLSEHSRATLSKAIRIANDEDASLSILHVNLYQENGRVTRTDLKDAVENSFGYLPGTRYVVRSGFLVEETILDEIISEGADVVVIGQKQTSRWREMIRRLLDDPDLERYLDNELDCRIVTVSG